MGELRDLVVNDMRISSRFREGADTVNSPDAMPVKIFEEDVVLCTPEKDNEIKALKPFYQRYWYRSVVTV
jgi:hypothetical protein